MTDAERKVTADWDIREITSQDELYEKFEGQEQEQSVYLEIDAENETIEMGINSHVGVGVDADEYYERVLRFYLPFVPKIDVANRLMEEALPLAVRIAAGHQVDFDGNNEVGELDEDAEEARKELGELIESLDASDRMEEWDWDVVKEAGKDINYSTSDTEIDRIVKDYEDRAEEAGAVIVCDLEEMLREIRDEDDEMEEEGEGLDEDEIKACEWEKGNLGSFGVFYRKMVNYDFVRFIYHVNKEWRILDEIDIDDLMERYENYISEQEADSEK